MNRLARIARAIPPEVWALLLVAIPLAVRALMQIDLINHSPGGLKGPTDPDPWLRLTLVRDWLSGGDWFNHEMLRSNAPTGGIASPWTRPLDLVIAALVGLQPGDAALTTKLMRAAAALPVLWMVLLSLGLFKAVRQLNPAPASYFLATALVGTTPVLWSYFGNGNADHHAMLVALWIWVLAYAITPEPRPRDCWTQGLLMALMLWVSPEALILIGALYVWQGLRWLLDGQRIMPLAHLTSATAYGALLALVIERAPGTWLVPVYDSISIVHVVLLALCAALVRVLALLPERFMARRHYRLLAAKLGSMAVLLLMAALYPKFFHGPMVDAAPFIFTDFLPRIKEARPLFSKPALFIIALLFLPLLAAAVHGWLLKSRSVLLPRAASAQLLFLLAVTLALTFTQMRWYYYVFPLTALMLAPAIALLFTPGETRFAKRAPWQQTCIRLAVIATVLGLPMLLVGLTPDKAGTKSKRTATCEYSARKALYSGRLARALGHEPLVLYAPTNLGAEIMFFTPYRIIASNYHREAEGIRYLWDGLRISDENELRAYLARRKVDAVLVCPDGRASADSVLIRWQQGKQRPGWVKRLPLNGRAKGPAEPLLLRIAKEPK